MPKSEFTLVGPEGAEVSIQEVGGTSDGLILWEFSGAMTSDDLLAIAIWLRQNRPDSSANSSAEGFNRACQGYQNWSVMDEGGKE